MVIYVVERHFLDQIYHHYSLVSKLTSQNLSQIFCLEKDENNSKHHKCKHLQLYCKNNINL